MSLLAARTAIAAHHRAGMEAAYPNIAIQDDPNLPFIPPSDAWWIRLTLRDGAPVEFPGSPLRLVRTPILAYVDAFTTIGEGDGPATEICETAETMFRRWSDGAGTRQRRFEKGPEGNVEGFYRKQLIVVCDLSERK